MKSTISFVHGRIRHTVRCPAALLHAQPVTCAVQCHCLASPSTCLFPAPQNGPVPGRLGRAPVASCSLIIEPWEAAHLRYLMTFACCSEYRLVGKVSLVFGTLPSRPTENAQHWSFRVRMTLFSRRELCEATLATSRPKWRRFRPPCASGCGGGEQSHPCRLSGMSSPSAIPEQARVPRHCFTNSSHQSRWCSKKKKKKTSTLFLHRPCGLDPSQRSELRITESWQYLRDGCISCIICQNAHPT